ncbi:LysM domain-containing protein [Paraphaeosphaeria sporulosa]
MKMFRSIASALALILPVAQAYLVGPPGTPAPGATSSCSGWAQSSYGMTCSIIERLFGMTEAQLKQWNPSISLLGDGCNLIQGLYYCVQVDFVSISVSPFPTPTPPPTSTLITLVTTTSSKTGNGIATPTPTQTGMISSCNKFYKVLSGDGCYNIATANGITLENFYAWNPAVGSICGSLWPDYYVCVGIIGSSSSTKSVIPTTTSSGNGITTPTPVQYGITNSCTKFYFVKSDDNCYNIAQAEGVALNDFYSWNPAVGSSCGTLQPDYYVCIAGPKTATPTPTPTKGSTPTPVQSGISKTCKKYYLVKSGDGCYNIAQAAGITLDNFYAWNPAVGNACGSLWPDYYVCIGQ